MAAVGEISHDDWSRLKLHLEECSECRSVFADVGEIYAKWLPELPNFEITRDPQSDARLRKTILKRASKEGARLSEIAQAGSLPLAAGRSGWQATRVLPVAGVAAALLMTISILFFEQNRGATKPNAQAVTHLDDTLKADVRPGAQPSAAANSAQAEQFRAALERALEASQAQQTALRKQLEGQGRRADSVQQSSADAARVIEDLKQQLGAAHGTQARAEADLAQLKSVQDANEAVIIAQQQEIRELNEKVADQSASVERERQLLSDGREIRDLIAARNLHIIDVYDTDSHGKTSRAFGRVFYTEGRSLVFYAYDLSAQHPESGKYAFYVWGKRDGAPHDIKNLGALNRDDQLQKRWVLAITDPKVLAEIDSVFVTLEPTERPGKHPTGTRLLSAFLGSPANHP
jgi:hypothetical protein